jgi:predicted TPR repeat methyltransferase
MPPPMPWWTWFAPPGLTRPRVATRDLLRRFPDVHDGWDRLGMVHEAGGDSRQAADCYRRVIDFIGHDSGMAEQFARLVASLDPPTAT